MVSSKPRIPAASAPLLLKIDSYIRQYDMRGPGLASAASDVLDGLAMRHELEPLVRRRLLTVIPYGEDAAGWWCRDDSAMCGRTFSVHLTDRAMQALWPERAPGVEGRTK